MNCWWWVGGGKWKRDIWSGNHSEAPAHWGANADNGPRCCWPPGKLWKCSLESNPVTLQATLSRESQSLCIPMSVYALSLHLKLVCHSLLTCLKIGALNHCVIFQTFLYSGTAEENFDLLPSFPLFFNCSRTFGAWHAINSIQVQPKSLTGSRKPEDVRPALGNLFSCLFHLPGATLLLGLRPLAPPPKPAR